MNEAGESVVDVLVANHRHFLAFLERRVGSRAVAEDLLQEAFVRGIDRAPSLRRPEAATAWFYRMLRNALVDHYRRQGAESRALAAAALEAPEADNGEDEELHRLVCGCIGELVDTLRPEYASAIRRVELEGVPVRQFAGEAGITPNNAAVRLHRARESLRRQVVRSCGTCAEHGCEDCTCRG
jgi:RNA polymerase sigma-70 factor (ECF subfamily)